MLRAVGYKDADFKKPAIGIASTWSNLTPCNMHIDRLAKAAAAAVARPAYERHFGTQRLAQRWQQILQRVDAQAIGAIT